MADFDPTSLGAVAVDKFDPASLGAVPVEHFDPTSVGAVAVKSDESSSPLQAQTEDSKAALAEISGLPVATPNQTPGLDFIKRVAGDVDTTSTFNPKIPYLPAHVEDMLDLAQPISGVRPSAIARAGVDLGNFLQSPQGVGLLGTAVLDAPIQKAIAGAFAATAIKHTPDLITDLFNAKTPEEQRQAQTALINNTLMGAGGAAHALGVEASTGERPSGAPQKDINAAIRDGDLGRTANADTAPEMLDPIVQARDAVKAQLDKQPNETLQKTHDVLANQLANVPESVIAESRNRIAQQAQSPEGAAPTAADTVQAPPSEQPTTDTPAYKPRIEQAAGEIAPETAAAVDDTSPAAEDNNPQGSIAGIEAAGEPFSPPDEPAHPTTTLDSGEKSSSSPTSLGITPKLPPFFEGITDMMAGASNHPAFKDATDSIKGWIGGMAGRTFPKLTVLDRGLGELGARWISSKIAAKPSAMVFASKVLDGLGVDPVKFGAALTEDNLRSVRNGLDQSGEAERAALVKTAIAAKGSPFKTESDYQDFLNDPATKEAIERHKSMWDSVIEPMYRKAMSIDPDEELPGRGMQTGARINLHSIIEGEKPADNIVTVGQGNLLGTMRRKSIFGRQATGAGETYGSNYFGIMDNTFAKQLEVANKNAFEDALVEKGFAKIDKPGQQLEINGRQAASFPYKRQTIVLPSEQGAKSVPQSRNIYIDPRLKSEYASGANVLRSGLGDSTAVKAFSNIINNAALTGLTDATVHVSNLATALFTRPGGNILTDSLLSAAGRADIPVKIVQSVMKAFGDNSAQLKQLAEIGALREDHLQGGKLNPMNWTGKLIQAADKTTRLVLDDTYKKLADSGLVENNETNRREFVNQVGQYNKRAQPAMIRALRDSGVSPFVTAGKTFNSLAIRTATLDPGLKAASLPAAVALRANQLSKWVGAGALVATLNYLITGKVTGRAGVPIGSIDTGKSDKNNRPLYIKAFDMMGLGRAMRATGARGFVASERNGLTTGDALNSAGRDIYNTATAPFIGPPIRFLSTLGNIPTAMGIGKPVPAVAPGENQIASNAKAALIQASPLVASIADSLKPGGGTLQSLQRQLPRYLPQSGNPDEMMNKYPEIVHRAQAREFINDVIGQVRKLEPAAKKEFLDSARNRLAPSDQDQFDRTLKYSHIF